MVPLRLRLKNFLSYGEDAPVLHLEDIHVACLSGGNGQGKSALLDAMTWAVWGEGRKSSEARKPDEELLRVGARQMEVDFAFAVDGAELRVVRSYQQSASGKTSKPGLELQVLDGDAWRPLTAESLRATQAVIDERVGIDYETFINSTFLLQGRSDEFTKKRPGERKEILGKILGLDRYERMAVKAGQRWSGLRERAKQLDGEDERLAAALEPVGEWEQERNGVREAVEAATVEVKTATETEAGAASRLSALDAAAREAETLQKALADLSARRDRADRETAEVTQRIETAETLVGQSEAIEAANVRYEELRKERSALDEKATLFRGLDTQRVALQQQVDRQQTAAEVEITKQKGALDVLDTQIKADEVTVASGDRIESALATAQTAAQQSTALDALLKRRDDVNERVESIDKRIAAEQGQMSGRYKNLVEEGRRLKQQVEDDAPPDTAAFESAVAAAAAAAARQEALREQGTEAAATVKAQDARLGALAEDRDRVLARAAKLRASDDEACPTCGTELTDGHRAEVLAGYAREVEEIAAAVAAARRERDQAAQTRDALRAEFATLQKTAEEGAVAATALASAQERAGRRAQSQARLVEMRTEARDLKAKLDGEAFAPGLRAERLTLTEALAEIAYDAATHDAARRAAAHLDAARAQARALGQARESLDQRRQDRARRQSTLDQARERLTSGAATQETRRKMEAVDQQIAAVGFDPAAHERVVRELSRLDDAPRRLAALLDARRQIADLSERRTRLAEDRRAIEADRATRAASLAALQSQLAEREAAEAERTAARSAREAAAARLAQAQGRLGALTERLERADRDRERRAEVRKELREVKKTRALYGHLRKAFGKHGIPSLIIEQTLPEIEARANELLTRLSGGSTRVALETLKEKKTGGGTRETLDIRITDAQGVSRAYETYSGGEAFRVNFALRIALSQMLAERSGTPIRTLVVDEGFGTQDKEGLQALIGAIDAVKDDFDTILVITHLDEIKDAFPTRIEVRKEPVTGSTFEVVSG